MEYLNEYKKWCTSDVFDEETKKELINIKNDNKEIEDIFVNKARNVLQIKRYNWSWY